MNYDMSSELIANTDFTLKFEVIESPPGTPITPVDVTLQTTFEAINTESVYVDAPDNKNAVISSNVTIISCVYNGYLFSGAAIISLTGTTEKVLIDKGQTPLRENDKGTVVLTGVSGGSTLQWVLRATIDNAGQSKVRAV